VDLKDIKAIIDLMKKNAISEFEMEKQDFKIRLKRGLNGGTPVSSLDEFPPAVAVAAPTQIPVATTPAAATPPPVATGEVEIKSPMIGTFYRAPSPEAASYVEVGTDVNADTVVCIIEAMKVMNEIKAEVKGVVTQVLVENAKPVEFGQPLFKVRPS
jgi:acetyl-CoA carboxylase biotin carboxyl carrier protein